MVKNWILPRKHQETATRLGMWCAQISDEKILHDPEKFKNIL